MNQTLVRVLIPVAVNFVALAARTFFEVMICEEGVPQPRPERRRAGLYSQDARRVKLKFMGN